MAPHSAKGVNFPWSASYIFPPPPSPPPLAQCQDSNSPPSRTVNVAPVARKGVGNDKGLVLDVVGPFFYVMQRSSGTSPDALLRSVLPHHNVSS